jgi:TadE-like protein
MSRLWTRSPRERQRSQSLVEYAITVPIFLLILLGMLEFGFAFSHHLSMEYATREGARTGAALASGTIEYPCNEVDPQVMAAFQRVLVAAGSQVKLGDIGEVRIYKADADGHQVGSLYNRWEVGPGPVVAGEQLKFRPASPQNWSACPTGARKNLSTGGSDRVDSIGVSMTYTYGFVTPLASLMGLAGAGEIQMSDRTVMALNPTLK